MNKNLDIIVFENNENEMIKGLNKISNGFNIIYNNLSTELNIGHQKVKDKKYESIIYNEENNTMIILSNKSLFKIDDIINYLETKNLLFSIIDFESKTEDVSDKLTPDIYFANSKKRIEEYLMDSLEKGIYKCLYFPLIDSSLKFGYKVRYGNLNDYITKNYKGLIQLDDKIILIENQYLDNNLVINVSSILMSLGFRTKIMTKKEPDLHNGYEYKKLIKKLY